jgi:16S rRNA (cytosine967-C5)-methyltransferase
MGVYQLLHTGIAEHAAVYETVSLCKRLQLSSAASFVNGILRAVQAHRSSLPQPSGNPAKVLSIQWSHPQWLTERWLKRFGEEETALLMQANNRPPPVYLRVNDLRTSNQMVTDRLKQEGVSVTRSAFGPNVLLVTEGSAQLTRSFADGDFYIQDAASERIGEAVNPAPGMRVLEIAAAPGGKTLQLAARMKDEGLIVAVDSESKRMILWQRNRERMQIRCAVPLVADARSLTLLKKFDRVVVDAPCSSLGVVRRHPEVRWWRKEEDLRSFQSLQLKILDSCAKYVDDKGELVYSVCSFEPEETVQVQERFLATHTRFEKREDLFLLPHRDETDGFFIARFAWKTW